MSFLPINEYVQIKSRLNLLSQHSEQTTFSLLSQSDDFTPQRWAASQLAHNAKSDSVEVDGKLTGKQGEDLCCRSHGPG